MVEHFIGNEEVEGSILSGGTSKLKRPINLKFIPVCDKFPANHLNKFQKIYITIIKQGTSHSKP